MLVSCSTRGFSFFLNFVPTLLEDCMLSFLEVLLALAEGVILLIYLARCVCWGLEPDN